MGKEEFVLWLSDVRREDVGLVGEVGVALGEMRGLKLPVAEGFVVTTKACKYFFDKSGINGRVKNILLNLNVENRDELKKASEKICALIGGGKVPEELESEIVEAYDVLGAEKAEAESLLSERGATSVSVRNSVHLSSKEIRTHHARGEKNFSLKLKKGFCSFYSEGAIYERGKRGDELYFEGAVIVQKMIEAKKSGVVFSRGLKDKDVIVRALFGLSEGISRGYPQDSYRVSPNIDNFEIKKVEIPTKENALVRDDEQDYVEVKLNKQESESQVLNNYEVKRLAQFAKIVEEFYGKPQGLEFAIDEKGIHLVGTQALDFGDVLEDGEEKIEKTEESKEEEILKVVEEEKGINPRVDESLVNEVDVPVEEYEGVKEEVKKNSLFDDKDVEEIVLQELEKSGELPKDIEAYEKILPKFNEGE